MTAQTLKTMTHSLDAWLWRRGIGHPVIRPLVRNELLLTALFLLGGGAAFSATPWFFWFGVGLGIMTLTFWSLARFFLRAGLGRIQHRVFTRGIVALGRQAAAAGRAALLGPDSLQSAGNGHSGRPDRRGGHGSDNLCRGFA